MSSSYSIMFYKLLENPSIRFKFSYQLVLFTREPAAEKLPRHVLQQNPGYWLRGTEAVMRSAKSAARLWHWPQLSFQSAAYRQLQMESIAFREHPVTGWYGPGPYIHTWSIPTSISRLSTIYVLCRNYCRLQFRVACKMSGKIIFPWCSV